MADEEQKTEIQKVKAVGTTEAPKGAKDLDKILSDFTAGTPQAAAQEVKEKKTVRRTSHSKKRPSKQVVMGSGKRKEAIARARLANGAGIILVNGVNAELIKPREVRELILEPVRISREAEELMRGSKVTIEVHGGGMSGQAQAARSALAKTLVAASGSESLKRAYMDYDRNLLVDDHRRVEPKKFLGPKARARFQTSYR